MLGDEPADDKPETSADPEDGRHQPDAPRHPLGRKLVPDDRERERKMPPATPWAMRATIRTPSEPASAASRVPATSVTSVHTSSRRLPYMSPSLPMIAVPTDAESRNPVSGQVTPVSLACRLRWIVGSAGITAEARTA